MSCSAASACLRSLMFSSMTMPKRGAPDGIAHHRRGDVHPDRLAVTPDDPPFGAAVIERRRRSRSFQSRWLASASSACSSSWSDAAAELLLHQAEHLLQRAVGFDQPPDEIDAGDADQRRLEDRAEALFALGERLLGALALGDVAEVDDHRADARVAQAADADRLERSELAVLVQAAVAGLTATPGLPRTSAKNQAAGSRSSGCSRSSTCRPTSSSIGVAEDARHRSGGVHHHAVGTDQVDAVGAVLDEEAEALLALPQQLVGAACAR